MERVLDALDLAVDIFITAFIIAILVGLAYYGSSRNDATSENLQYYYNKDAYFDYNGSVIDGSTAIYLSESSSADGEILVKIFTKTHPDGFITTTDIKDVRSEYYVDPARQYLCNTIQNLSGDTVAMQIIEVGTNLYSSTEDDLANEIVRLNKANAILSKSIKETETLRDAAKTENVSDVDIEVDAMEAYKRYMFYSKMQEFYGKWRAAL